MKTHKQAHLTPGTSAAHSLIHIAEWGTLRSQELVTLLKQEGRQALQNAQRYIKQLSEQDYIRGARLPGPRSGNAWWLSKRGERWLDEHGEAGHKGRKQWQASIQWEHHLLAQQALIALSQRGYSVRLENDARSESGGGIKHPDGLVSDEEEGFSYWLEVENKTKKGKEMGELAAALIGAATGKPLTVHPSMRRKWPVDAALVAYDPAAVDARGYKLNHRERVAKAIAAATKEGVSISFLRIERDGYTVKSVEMEEVYIAPAR